MTRIPSRSHAARRQAGAVAILCLYLGASVVRAELIDRVLAVVEGQVVTLSDVRAVLRFGLVPPDVSDDPIQAALRRLIERRLILVEVERYAPPAPPDAEVEAGLAAVRARFTDAQAFEDALQQTPMSRDEMRRYIRDSLRIDSYLQQRFSSTAQPSDVEITAYYKEHASEFLADGALRPLPAVREQVIARIVGERRAEAIREWLAGLWRRGSVVVLPPSPRT